MAKTVDKKFGWVIKDFSSLQSEKCYSVPFLFSDCKWRLLAFPKGNNCDHLSLYLDVADSEALPCGWKKYVKLRMTLVNQLSQNLSILKETEHCFDGKSTSWGFPAMLPLSKLHDKDGGFLVKGEVMVLAEVDVFDVIGTSDETKKSEDASQLLSKKEENVAAESNYLLKKKETNVVNGTNLVDNSAKSPQRNKLVKIFLYLSKKIVKIAFIIFLFLLIVAAVAVAVAVAEQEKKARRF